MTPPTLLALLFMPALVAEPAPTWRTLLCALALYRAEGGKT